MELVQKQSKQIFYPILTGEKYKFPFFKGGKLEMGFIFTG